MTYFIGLVLLIVGLIGAAPIVFLAGVGLVAVAHLKGGNW